MPRNANANIRSSESSASCAVAPMRVPRMASATSSLVNASVPRASAVEIVLPKLAQPHATRGELASWASANASSRSPGRHASLLIVRFPVVPTALVIQRKGSASVWVCGPGHSAMYGHVPKSAVAMGFALRREHAAVTLAGSVRTAANTNATSSVRRENAISTLGNVNARQATSLLIAVRRNVQVRESSATARVVAVAHRRQSRCAIMKPVNVNARRECRLPGTFSHRSVRRRSAQGHAMKRHKNAIAQGMALATIQRANVNAKLVTSAITVDSIPLSRTERREQRGLSQHRWGSGWMGVRSKHMPLMFRF